MDHQSLSSVHGSRCSIQQPEWSCFKSLSPEIPPITQSNSQSCWYCGLQGPPNRLLIALDPHTPPETCPAQYQCPFSALFVLPSGRVSLQAPRRTFTFLFINNLAVRTSWAPSPPGENVLPLPPQHTLSHCRSFIWQPHLLSLPLSGWKLAQQRLLSAWLL